MPEPNAKRFNKWTWVQLNGDQLRNWRLDQQLSQRAAAKVCDIAEVTWRRCECGRRVKTLTAARLAKKLGLELSELRVK